jgi:hypothetical protein
MKFFQTVKGKLTILTISTAIGFLILIALSFMSNHINENHKNIYQELVGLKGEIVALKTVAIYEIDQQAFDKKYQQTMTRLKNLSSKVENSHFDNIDLNILSGLLQGTNQAYHNLQERFSDELQKDLATKFDKTELQVNSLEKIITTQIKTKENQFFYMMLIVALLNLFIVTAISLYISKNLSRNLHKIISFINIKNDDRKLDDELKLDTEDEISQIATHKYYHIIKHNL